MNEPCIRKDCTDGRIELSALCREHYMESVVAAHTPPGAEEYHALKELDYAIEYGWD